MDILYKATKYENGGVLKNGSFKNIHDTVLPELEIHDTSIKVNTRCIQQQVLRNSLTVDLEINNHPYFKSSPSY